ncbi:MAG: penicillin-binding protein [Bacilli bacterium]
MKKEINNDKFRISKPVIIVTFFLFIVLIIRLCYLCLFDYKVGNSTITAFIKNRNTTEEVIMPKRGTIYDANGNILANDVISYTLIAYLSDTRVDSKGNKDYVEDIDGTSSKLADVLGASADDIKSVLINGKENNKYQVEFGSIGKGLSELAKEEIDELNLQGIDFIKDIKRYYPNGDFASYLIGYTVNKEDDDGNNFITGEMGIEEYYNDTLKGKTGFVTYEKDKYGYKIANGREYIEPAEDGNDIYLTIDNNIQLFIHNAVNQAQEESDAEWVLMAVMDAKTGKILGYSSTPSFDPNLRNMTSYIDPLVTLTYEPGSTMKIFSYMCAIDSGNYDGNTTYTSGSKTYTSENGGKDVTISDWKKEGWGVLTYDQGFALSSNIAVANIVESVITKEDLKTCYAKYGFGNKTNFTLKREESGNINYTYQIEAATAGYGQGITTTPIQHLQALTAIANNGTMLKPYVVDKIKDSNTGKILEENKKTELTTIIKSSTVDKMKELMANVINGDNTNSTGYAYYMDGYSLIGKTGTAQIFDYTKGKYMSGASDYIYSFSGMFPGDDPEIILYAAIKRPKDTTNYVAPMIREVEKNITKYLNIEEKSNEKKSYLVESFYNKKVNEVKTLLESKNIKVLVIGDGTEIVNQYPSVNSTIYEDDLVVLKTNNYDKRMIDLDGYSYKEVDNILRLMGVSYILEGNGYVYEQSIPVGEVINDTITIKLKNKYTE